MLTSVLDHENDYKVVPLVGLNDFHGQLDPTTLLFDGINVSVGGAPFLATMFDEELANLPGVGADRGSGRQRRRIAAELAAARGHPDDRRRERWGLKATSFGNHEFDYGVPRILKHEARAHFPFLATNIVETATGKAPPWVTPSTVVQHQRRPRRDHRRRAPEHAGARLRRQYGRARPSSRRVSASRPSPSGSARRRASASQVVVIHQGTADGLNPTGQTAGIPTGPILGIADELQGTTVDAMVVGHTHRISNLMRGEILITEGINAGISYSVLQLLVKGQRRGLGRRRDARRQDLGVPARAE